MIDPFPDRNEKHLINAQPPHTGAAVLHYIRETPSKRCGSGKRGKKI